MKTKKKIILYSLGLILIGIASYQYAIKRTLTTIEEYERLEASLANTQNVSIVLPKLKKQKTTLDSILLLKNQPQELYQSQLLAFIQKESESNTALNLTSFLEPHIVSLDNNKITEYSYIFKLEGDYKSLENLFYNLSQNYPEQAASIDFRIEKEYYNSKENLTATIILTRKRIATGL